NQPGGRNCNRHYGSTDAQEKSVLNLTAPVVTSTSISILKKYQIDEFRGSALHPLTAKACYRGKSAVNRNTLSPSIENPMSAPSCSQATSKCRVPSRSMRLFSVPSLGFTS